MGCMCSGPGDCCENVGFYSFCLLLLASSSAPLTSAFELQQLYRYQDGYLCAVVQGFAFILAVALAACRAKRVKRRRARRIVGRIRVNNARGTEPTAPPPLTPEIQGYDARIFGSTGSRRNRRPERVGSSRGSGGGGPPLRSACVVQEAVEVEVRPLRTVLGRGSSGGSPRRSLPPGVHRRVNR